ncbi:unnamed protein product [Closterium sp. NIES-54]
MVRHRLVSGLPESLTPLPRSPAPPCTPGIEGQQRTAPHSSSFPLTTAPFQTLHLDVWGPFPVLGPHQERYFLIVVDHYSRCTTIFPLQRKADVPTGLEPWLLARGGAQGLCGGSPGAAADFRVWGSLAHVCAPGVNNLSARTHACVFLGFSLDASSLVFYDPVTHQFFASQEVTFDESLYYDRTRPHRGTDIFSPLLFLTLEPPQVVPGVWAWSSLPWRTWQPRLGGLALRHPLASRPSHGSLLVLLYGRLLEGAGGTGGVGGGCAGSGGAGAGGTGTLAPTPRTVRFLTCEQRLLQFERVDQERFERARQQQQEQEQSQGDPHAEMATQEDAKMAACLDIPIPCTHAEAVSGPWASYRIARKEAELASYRSTGTYVDAVPPPGANDIRGMWLYKVKRPRGSPLVFKARYVARGFNQQEGVEFFQTFAPTPKMTTLRMMLHIAAQCDYELHSLEFPTAFLQGSLHEQI